MGPMSKLSQLRLVRAITFAGMSSISFTIVGSMFLIISVLPQAFPVLAGIWAATFDKIAPIYMLAYAASMGAISLYFLVATSFEYARIFEEEDEVDIKPLNAVLMGVFGLFLLMPQIAIVKGVIALVNVAKGNVINGWMVSDYGLDRLGATGIFTAIIVSWFTVRIYVFCVNRNIVIKLPDVVPEGVARSFTALVPGFFIALICMLIQGGLMALGTDVYRVIAIPFSFVTNLSGTWPGMLVIFFLIHALWLVGIHGATIVSSFLTPIVLANLQSNAAGTTHAVLAGEFYNAFVHIGGSGCTLGLTFLMLFLAKSDQLKYIARAEIAPAFFNINEPLIFGLPIVYNPALALPFLLAPMAAMSVAYFAISLNIIPAIIVQMPWPTPVGLGAFISCGGSLSAALTAIVGVVVATLIYYPFFKHYDTKLYHEEQEKLAADRGDAAA